MPSEPIRILVTGCSGGGKSTLLNALQTTGIAVVQEPGRRVIANHRAGGLGALPWEKPLEFAQFTLEMARVDFLEAGDGLTVFDRGLVDAASAIHHLTGCALNPLTAELRYSDPVFVAPPWPEIFVTDPDRRHTFEDAVAEHDRLLHVLNMLGYAITELPKMSPNDRSAFVRGQFYAL